MKTKKKLLFNLTIVFICIILTFVCACAGLYGDNLNNDVHKTSYDTRGIVFEDLTVEYDGQPHSIYATNLPEGVSVEYENNNHTTAGAYKVTAHFTGADDDTHYKLTLDKTAMLVITKKTYDTRGIVFEDLTVEYDGQPHSIYATNLPEGVGVEYENNNQTTVGTHKVTAHFTGDCKNYNDLPDKTAVLTILPVGKDDISNIEFTLDESSNTYSVTAYKGNADNPIIPRSYNNLPVTAIGENAFKDNKSLFSITIPDSITQIGNYAFASCTSLVNVEIPDSVTYIDGYAFYECENLISIEIPDSVTFIGGRAFSHCLNLKNIIIGNGITYIGYQAFYQTEYYKNASNWQNDILYLGSYLLEARHRLSGSYTVKSGTTLIAHSAFSFCDKVTSITLPDSVKYIGNSAFDRCTSLESINIPSGVLSIGEFAFSESGIKSIKIPDGLTQIERCTFFRCKNLESINISDNITEIGESAFYECTSLESVNFGENSKLTSIGEFAFVDCEKLDNLTIPESVNYLFSWAFTGTGYYNNDENWEDGVLYCGTYLLDARETLSGSYTVKPSTRVIAGYAFKGCVSLESAIIPDSVTHIGEACFSACKEFRSITIGKGVIFIGARSFYGCSLMSAVFENKSGWTVDNISISSSDLEDTLSAAIYIMLQYGYANWTRSL